jgi:hypothetical protein
MEALKILKKIIDDFDSSKTFEKEQQRLMQEMVGQINKII